MRHAYFLLVVMLMCGGAILACVIAFRGREHVVYRIARITNTTPPDVVHKHFGGSPLRTFVQSELGLPADGFCEDRSNGSSWRVITCYGTQPESQP
jgi:hypothetical protein